MIYVFLTEKLISCDTITPMLLEVSKQFPDEKIVVSVFQVKAYEGIVSNVVLYEVLSEVGEFHLLADKFSVGLPRQLMRIRRWWFFLIAMVRGVMGRATFVHFGQLNDYPRRILFLVNRKRTFLFQASPVGLSETEKKVDRLRYPNPVLSTNLAAGALVAQNRNWIALDDENFSHLPRFFITPPGSRRVWREYIASSAKRYIEEVGLNVEQDLVVFVLSSLDPPNMTFYEDEFVQLFERTLEILAEEIPNIPVIVKCHPATTKEYYDRIDEIVERTPHQRVAVANIHPMMLASQARFFISNALSTTYFNAQVFGVPVIEYTHYSTDVLEATGGLATRPDLTTHFINFEEDKLRLAIAEVMAAPKPHVVDEHKEDAEYEKVMRLLVRQ